VETTHVTWHNIEKSVNLLNFVIT